MVVQGPHIFSPAPRFRGRATALALFVSLGCAAAVDAQTWGGTAAVVSKRVSRGIDLSGDQAGATLDVFYRDDRNWAVNLGLGTMNASASGARVEAILSATRWWQVDDQRTITVSAAHYAYAGGSSPSQLRYSEVSVGGNWDAGAWGQWGGTVSLSPDLGVSTSWGYLGHRGGTIVELTWHRRLVGALAADLGWGRVDHWGGERGSYHFSNAGLSYPIGDWRVSVSRVQSSVPADGKSALQRWIAGLAWSF